MLSKNDYKILMCIYQYGCINEMKSLTVAKISEITKLSIPKVRKSMKQFKSLGYIKEGVVSHNAKTYYVSNEGINKINELM